MKLRLFSRESVDPLFFISFDSEIRDKDTQNPIRLPSRFGTKQRTTQWEVVGVGPCFAEVTT